MAIKVNAYADKSMKEFERIPIMSCDDNHIMELSNPLQDEGVITFVCLKCAKNGKIVVKYAKVNRTLKADRLINKIMQETGCISGVCEL